MCTIIKYFITNVFTLRLFGLMLHIQRADFHFFTNKKSIFVTLLQKGHWRMSCVMTGVIGQSNWIKNERKDQSTIFNVLQLHKNANMYEWLTIAAGVNPISGDISFFDRTFTNWDHELSARRDEDAPWDVAKGGGRRGIAQRLAVPDKCRWRVQWYAAHWCFEATRGKSRATTADVKFTHACRHPYRKPLSAKCRCRGLIQQRRGL